MADDLTELEDLLMTSAPGPYWIEWAPDKSYADFCYHDAENNLKVLFRMAGVDGNDQTVYQTMYLLAHSRDLERVVAELRQMRARVLDLEAQLNRSNPVIEASLRWFRENRTTNLPGNLPGRTRLLELRTIVNTFETPTP
jgi:hypothetical protein